MLRVILTKMNVILLLSSPSPVPNPSPKVGVQKKRKKMEFSQLGGGAFIFDNFSHFQKLISKHALNHAKM